MAASSSVGLSGRPRRLASPFEQQEPQPVQSQRGCTVAVAVTVREVDAAHTAVPVDALVSGETTTCLFRSAGSLGPPVQN